jgi:hypothetical protein
MLQMLWQRTLSILKGHNFASCHFLSIAWMGMVMPSQCLIR